MTTEIKKQEESPEVAQAFGGLIQSVSNMEALEPKIKQLIYTAIRASQGETTTVTAHVPMAKRAGATRNELKEAIIMTATVCGIKGIASCLVPAWKRMIMRNETDDYGRTK